MRYNITFAHQDTLLMNLGLIHDQWQTGGNVDILRREIDATIAWYSNVSSVSGKCEVVEVPYNPPEDFDTFKFLHGEAELVRMYNEASSLMAQRLFKD